MVTFTKGRVPIPTFSSTRFSAVLYLGFTAVLMVGVAYWQYTELAATLAAQGVDVQVWSAFAWVIGAALAGILLLGVIHNASNMAPLIELRDAMSRMADGDLGVPLESDREDEIGSVYRDVEAMRVSFRDRLEAADAFEEQYRDVMQRTAEGDLTVRIDESTQRGEMVEVARMFNDMMDRIEGTIGSLKAFGDDVAALGEQVAASAEEVSTASQEVSESVLQIAEGAGEQTDRLLDISQQMNDMSAGIQQISSSADELSNLAREAVEGGQEGRVAAQAALTGMAEIRTETDNTVAEVEALDEQMSQIGEIVEVITDIAEQTNILALNANIEAARAGEAGEGFAVVSHEVKSLAEKTKESAEQIAQLIRAVQTQRENVVEGIERMDERVTDGSQSVEEALRSLETIVDQVELTSAGFAEVDAATDQQADAAQQVLGTTDEVAGISEETSAEAQNVSAAAEEQTSALTEVTSSVRELSENAGELQRLLGAYTVRGHGDADETEQTPKADLVAPTALPDAPRAPVAAPDGGRDEH